MKDAIVNMRKVDVRLSPNDMVIDTLYEGHKVVILDSEPYSDWVEIYYELKGTNEGRRGFVQRRFLK